MSASMRSLQIVVAVAMEECGSPVVKAVDRSPPLEELQRCPASDDTGHVRQHDKYGLVMVVNHLSNGRMAVHGQRQNPRIHRVWGSQSLQCDDGKPSQSRKRLLAAVLW